MKNQNLTNFNYQIAESLGVEPLKITYKVSEKAKSKFGHCRYIEHGHYLINLSSFILGTDLEKDTICHELCHAYDHHYFKSLSENNDPNPHGVAWKMLMKEVFGYNDVKAQGIHQSNSMNNKLVKIKDNHFDLYIDGNKKAKFKISYNVVNIRTPQNKFFDDIKEEENYMNIFVNLY